MRSASLAGRERRDARRGRASRRGSVRLPRSSASSRSSSSAPSSSSALNGSSRISSSGSCRSDAAEREPLQHPARERRGALAPRLPEPEALEQHPDPLAPLRDAVEAAVELEVLERASARGRRAARGRGSRSRARSGSTSSAPSVGASEPGAEPQQRRLPGAVRPGDDEEAAARELEVDAAQDALRPVALLEPARAWITRARPRARRAKNPTADDAVHREERGVEPAQIARAHERVLVREQQRRPRRRRASRTTPTGRPSPAATSSTTVAEVQQPRAEERAPLAEARRDRVEALLPVDLDVEQRVEEVEAGDPERDRAAERPRLPRKSSR